MFSFNAAFVIGMLSLMLSRVPPREWLSLAVAVFGLGFAAIAVQPWIAAVLDGGRVGRAQAVLAGMCVSGCAYCAFLACRDIASPPDRR